MTALHEPIRFVRHGDVRTAYRQVGSGPFLVLIHGAEADHGMFSGLMDALAPHHTVVAYDQRDSGRTENGDTPYGLADLAGDAAALIGSLSQAGGRTRAHVFGTSFGGQVAQVLAARHAHLVDHLVLASTWSVDRRLAEVNAAAMVQLAALRGQLPRSAHQIAEYFFSRDYLAARPGIVDMFRGTQRRPDQARRRALLMQAPPPVIDFTAITAPTLLLAASADRLIPPGETFDLARKIMDARQQALPDLPHVAAIEDAGRVAHAIENFLLPRETASRHGERP